MPRRLSREWESDYAAKIRSGAISDVRTEITFTEVCCSFYIIMQASISLFVGIAYYSQSI